MLEVRANRNRNVVCVYSRGPRVTHYLGLEGVQLCTLQMPNNDFDREFDVPVPKTGVAFAAAYAKADAGGRRMIPLSGSAARVLTAILRGQPLDEVAASTLNHLENTMSEAPQFRKPDGPVAQVHAFLDKKLDAIKAGKISRKELIDQLVAKGLSNGTVTTQCGVWAKNNGVAFVRPAAAEATKKEAAAAKRAEKKGTKGKATAAA